MQRHGPMPSNDGGELRTLEQPAPLFDSHARAAAQTIIAIAIVLLALWVARDFLVALAWGEVLPTPAWAIDVRFAGFVFGGRSPTVAPLLFTLLTGLVLLAPVVLTAHQIAQGSNAVVRALNQVQKSGARVPGRLAQRRHAGAD